MPCTYAKMRLIAYIATVIKHALSMGGIEAALYYIFSYFLAQHKLLKCLYAHGKGILFVVRCDFSYPTNFLNTYSTQRRPREDLLLHKVNIFQISCEGVTVSDVRSHFKYPQKVTHFTPVYSID